MNTLGNEAEQEESIRQRYQARLAAIGLTAIGSSQDKPHPLQRGLRSPQASYILKILYEEITKRLNAEKANERKVTSAEASFIWQFGQEYRLKVYPQVWVGNLCLDFLIPGLGVRKGEGLRGFSFKGLAVEIDGPIHETFVKAKKDEFKEKSLSELGMILWRFSNEQVFQTRALPPREVMGREFKSICSNARAELWRKIRLITVLYHASDEQLRMLLKYSADAPRPQEVVWKS